MLLIAVVNSNACRLYHYDKHKVQLTLIKEINHPENKLKCKDLVSDKSGHYQASNSRGSYSPHMEPKEIKIDDFSREVAKELDHERNTNSCNELILIAPAHISGLLQQHFNKHVSNMIVKNIQKDILHLSEHELHEFVRTNTKYNG